MGVSCTVCIRLCSVNNELCGHLRVVASRTKCESYFNKRIVLYTSRTSRISVFWVTLLVLCNELYFCDSLFNFCESPLTSASCLWLLQVAPDFYESHMPFTTRILCESRFNNVSHVLYCESCFPYESCFKVRGAHYASRMSRIKCEAHFTIISPFPKPPFEIRVLASIADLI